MRAENSPTRFARPASRCLAGLLSVLLAVLPVAGQGTNETTTPAHHASSSKSKTAKKTVKKRTRRRRRRASRAVRMARTARIRQAFVASADLQPMAQQLDTLRTPEAYAGVTAWARRHTGEAAAAAYLALGHAYLLDKKYNEAEANLRKARQDGKELADYVDYLDAEASHGAGDDRAAEALLHGFTKRYPDSIFDDDAPALEANVLLALNNAAEARRVLDAAVRENPDLNGQAGFELAEGQVEFALGEQEEAGRIFKELLLGHPLSADASTAKTRLEQMGELGTLTVSERRILADAYYKGGRYEDAAEEYRALASSAALDEKTRDGFAVAEAACELKLKRLTKQEAEALPDSDDENGARRLYLLMELARDRDSEDDQQHIVTEMETRFPSSPWLEEALFSSGNMYLLKRDYPNAVKYYGYLAEHFPNSKDAPAAHWRAGWLSYRQGLYDDAARLFDEQIRLYPEAAQTVSALYWRGRLYQTREHNPARAAADYRTIVDTYPHYFYAQLARARLASLSIPASTDRLPGAPAPGNEQRVKEPDLERIHPLPAPRLVESFPVDSPHLARAKLLANAGLNEYIAREITADPDSEEWSALAEAQIYAAYGETFRAMRAIKRAVPYAMQTPIQSIPMEYWRILFPEPWWETIKAESAKNGLDPYLVVSLIRQESEFNPSAISYANAWGLMQLLPGVGRKLAREEGMSRFRTFQLLDPQTNIRLGTRYLRELMDQFGGVAEYALAAYNAGNTRVVDWEAAGPYQGMDEFVESIPFTQTREYVEAIMRNQEIYREIDADGGPRGGARAQGAR
jgi:peptidoglycan lytic transglycosylase